MLSGNIHCAAVRIFIIIGYVNLRTNRRNQKIVMRVNPQIWLLQKIVLYDSRLILYHSMLHIFVSDIFLFLLAIYFALMTSVLYQKYKHNSLIFYSHWYARFNIEAMTFICCCCSVAIVVGIREQKMG